MFSNEPVVALFLAACGTVCMCCGAACGYFAKVIWKALRKPYPPSSPAVCLIVLTATLPFFVLFHLLFNPDEYGWIGFYVYAVAACLLWGYGVLSGFNERLDS